MSVPSQSIQFTKRERKDSRALLNSAASPDLVFAVVGPAGSGTTSIAEQLGALCKSALSAQKVVHLKASLAIEKERPLPPPEGGVQHSKLDRAKHLQDSGDALRQDDPAAVASLLISEIKATRITWDTEAEAAEVKPIRGDSTAKTPRVFILDSLKHPAEVHLLRTVYREAFCLVGVVCETATRKSRLQNNKCSGSSADEIEQFMKRDESADDDWGQKVTDTFHLADFFVDNTPSRFLDGEENRQWVVPDRLGRLLDILSGQKVVRPLAGETGMYHAGGAQMRSACLSRQVGAALLDDRGNVLATGTNEVPKSGGGVYGSQFDHENSPDHRCAFKNRYCSNTRQQDEIIDEVIASIPALSGADRPSIKSALKKTSLGRLLEFSRAVHAEMDALLSAARSGAPTVGTKLFVTTFPCHYCARHIVTAGVEEVQYIEPYPKSKALSLHGDAIEQNLEKWKADKQADKQKEEDGGTPLAKVLFRPFTGVAPRLYERAFLKNRGLKDEAGTMSVGEPKWPPGLLQKSYLQLESTLEGSDDK